MRANEDVVAVGNMTPVLHEGFRVGTTRRPDGNTTDAKEYGGPALETMVL